MGACPTTCDAAARCAGGLAAPAPRRAPAPAAAARRRPARGSLTPPRAAPPALEDAAAPSAAPPAAAAPLPPQAPPAADADGALTDSEAEVSPGYFAPRGGRLLLESAAELRSTAEHRAWVGATSALLAATAAEGLARVDSPGAAASAALALAAAYVLSDLGTGIYHWSVDNYGDGSTPVVGGQIAAFQGHHERPWTITERQFANNVHQVFRPAAAPAAALLASAFFAPPAWAVWSSAFLGLCCMSQQFHAWAHMRKSELHPAVAAAQDAGLLISRRAHGAHHRAPFEGNYCIVSGLWNPLLDGTGFFRALERAVHAATGAAPRCWADGPL